MSITFAGAAVLTELNKTHALVKMEDGRIRSPGVAVSGAETATDKMTFSVHEAGFKNIEEPNSEDVVKTAFAAMTYAQYFPNAIILNPMTVNGMESEKDKTIVELTEERETMKARIAELEVQVPSDEKNLPVADSKDLQEEDAKEVTVTDDKAVSVEDEKKTGKGKTSK